MSTTSNPKVLGIPRSRGPKGALQAKRTFISLLPAERDELVRLADMDNRTHSAMARIYMVRGMQADPNFNPKNLVVDQSSEVEGGTV